MANGIIKGQLKINGTMQKDDSGQFRLFTFEEAPGMEGKSDWSKWMQSKNGTPTPEIPDSSAIAGIPDSGEPGAEVLPVEPKDITTGDVIRTPGQPTQYSEKWITDNNPNQAAAGKTITGDLWKSNSGQNWKFEEIEGKPGFYTAKAIPNNIGIPEIGSTNVSNEGNDIGKIISREIQLQPPTQEIVSSLENININDGLSEEEVRILTDAFSDPKTSDSAVRLVNNYLYSNSTTEKGIAEISKMMGENQDFIGTINNLSSCPGVTPYEFNRFKGTIDSIKNNVRLYNQWQTAVNNYNTAKETLADVHWAIPNANEQLANTGAAESIRDQLAKFNSGSFSAQDRQQFINNVGNIQKALKVTGIKLPDTLDISDLTLNKNGGFYIKGISIDGDSIPRDTVALEISRGNRIEIIPLASVDTKPLEDTADAARRVFNDSMPKPGPIYGRP
jgi:hypothetical protein